MQSCKERLDPPDQVLVHQARHGDTEAFEELVRRHYRRCIDLAMLFLHNHWDAEDQVQIALFKTHKHLAQYHGDAEFTTWLLRIVANECLMFLRERRRARFVYLDERSRESDTYAIEVPARSPDPEREFASREMKHFLRAEIRRVPPLLRHVILLHDIQELPMTAVAKVLRITVPAAKSRLMRARSELRQRLRNHFHTIGTPGPCRSQRLY